MCCRTLRAGDNGEPEQIAQDFESALALAAQQPNLDTVFVIGGGQVYKEAVRHPSCEALHVTDIQAHIECDTFFPEYPDCFTLWSSGKTIRSQNHAIAFKCYTRCARCIACPVQVKKFWLPEQVFADRGSPQCFLQLSRAITKNNNTST